MVAQMVVGLFHSSGIAEDSVHRLITEGVAPHEIAYRVLKEIGPIPPTSQPELGALEVDPMVFGNVRQGFAEFIRNGETAVFVHALTDEQVEFAVDVLQQYTPIKIEVVPLAAGPEPSSPR
jgi:hypothetical protein